MAQGQQYLLRGTGIPYADQPIAYVQGGNLYATPEHLQFLVRLARDVQAKGTAQAQQDAAVQQHDNTIQQLQAQLQAQAEEIAQLRADVAALSARR